MRIAYLTNRYPAASHSFIRREIVELEKLGIEIVRVSVRPCGEDVLDDEDRLEAKKTLVILDGAKSAAVAFAFREAASNFGSFICTLWLTLKVGWRSHQGLLWHLFYLTEALVLARRCRELEIEHIHAHFGTNPASIAMLVNEFCGVPYSFTAHGPDEFDRPDGLYLGEKIRRSKFAVAVSSYGRSQLMRWVETVHWNKIKIIHCGVDQSFVEATCKSPPESKRMVCVARLAPQKGLPLLVGACRNLKTRGVDFELTLVGDGELRPQIEEQIDLYGLAEAVRITGWVSGYGVRQALDEARVFVLPSLAEGLPVVIMEAMALGRPVIATYIAGIPELVQPGLNGWLVPAGDVNALADAMQDALERTTSNIREMGKTGRERVLERHNVTTEAKKLRDLFIVCEA